MRTPVLSCQRSNTSANACKKGDVVVMPDYGVAAMVFEKGGYAVHQNG